MAEYCVTKTVTAFFQTLQEFKKQQPNKYNIFIYHLLTVVLRFKKGAYPENVHIIYYCLIKLAFVLTAYVIKIVAHTLNNLLELPEANKRGVVRVISTSKLHTCDCPPTS